MRCINCGKESLVLLCENCRTDEILEQVYRQLMYFKPDDEQMGPYVRALAENYDDPRAIRDFIPDILKLFPDNETEYYHCMYCKATGSERFEGLALNYMDTHDFKDRRSQKILNSLLSLYISKGELVKPRKWYDLVRCTDGLSFDMYYTAADYYGKVGDYDVAEELIKRASKQLDDPSYETFIYIRREYAPERLAKLSASVQGWRTKKPYWPKTEARKRIIADIYDAKGIAHPRITKPVVVKESDFKALHEAAGWKYKDYSAFWCAEVFSMSGAKVVYQIAAVKVRNGIVTDTFQSFLKPWDGAKVKELAAKQAGVDLSVINEAEDVDLVMGKFFAFVGQDILVSTDAMGNQAKCISRVARYSGMNEIQNLFLDLLDYAADISDEFDMKHNTREYLLKYFALEQGLNALDNAKNNCTIYERLKEMDQ